MHAHGDRKLIWFILDESKWNILISSMLLLSGQRKLTLHHAETGQIFKCIKLRWLCLFHSCVFIDALQKFKIFPLSSWRDITFCHLSETWSVWYFKVSRRSFMLWSIDFKGMTYFHGDCGLHGTIVALTHWGQVTYICQWTGSSLDQNSLLLIQH